MALIYEVAPNGFFIQVGKIVKHYNLQKIDGQNLKADQIEISDTFQAMTLGAPDTMLDGFATTVLGWASQIVGRRSELAALALTRLQDRITILNEIGAVTTSRDEILPKLALQMTTDGETVKANVVAIATVSDNIVLATPNGSNIGDGECIATPILDGVTSPGSSPIGTYPPSTLYSEIRSELTQGDEDMVIRVDDDTANHDENFTWEGLVPDVAHGILVQPGSGLINGSLLPINGPATNLATDGRLEEVGAPAWEQVQGSTDITLETVQGDFHSWRLNDTAAGPSNFQIIRQEIAPLTPLKSYWLMARVKASDASPFTAAADLTLYIGTDTDTPVSTTSGLLSTVTVANGAFSTSYVLVRTLFIMPSAIEDTIFFYISVDGTVDTANTIDIYDMAVAEVTYGGGIGLAVIDGETTSYVAGDRFDLNVTNDLGGNFQSFWRESWGRQLPSATGAAETILDSLAE